MKIHPKVGRLIGCGVLGCLMALMLSLPGTVLGPWRHWLPVASFAAEAPSAQVQTLLDEGRDNFLRGQLPAAETALQTALSNTQAEGNVIGEVMVLSNLALVQGQMGQWPEANNSIASSLALLNASASPANNWQRVRAQTLNVQGRLQLGQGDAEAALASWEQTAAVYDSLGDRAGSIRSQLRQARALQAMGFYRRAVREILMPLEVELAAAPASPLKVRSLRDLAEALMTAADLDSAGDAAQKSLDAAKTLNLPDEQAATQLTLGNIAYAQAREQQNLDNETAAETAANEALESYDRAFNGSDRALRLRSQLNQLALRVEFPNFEFKEAEVRDLQSASQLASEVYEQINTAAPDRAGIYLRINLANSLDQLLTSEAKPDPETPRWEDVLALLNSAEADAIALQDARAEAHVLGYLGKVYQSQGQLETAQKLTEKALFAAQTVNATDISYRWFEQLGNLSKDLGDRQAAIAAYGGAVAVLKDLRSDLVGINPEVQFSFQKSIEPLHRELVSLLLEDEDPNQANLREVRSVLESLQLEELNNYLRAACLNSQEVSVDEISADNRVAVIYPILLPDKIGIIANLPPVPTAAAKSATATDSPPQEQLRYYTPDVEQDAGEAFDINKFEQDTKLMLRQLGLADYAVVNTAERLYNKLFPAALQRDLDASRPDTLVFIPDGVLRNIPMAVLFDGESYLVEKYSIAITPGLQLLNPEPLQARELSALTFGLTEAVPGWSALPSVADELNAIANHVGIKRFMNSEFTEATFRKTLADSSAPIVHLATHGKFSSQLDETFIQAWDEDRISIEELSEWLRGDRAEPVELLVLSACETATGDDRAALGLAGMAIRAGARSTVASLWQVDDDATAIFMDQFYRALATQSGNKAEALQAAQKYLIEEFPQDLDNPYYWAPFVLIGNWL